MTAHKKSNVGLCTENERHNENCSLTPLILKTHGVQVFSLLVQKSSMTSLSKTRTVMN